MKQNKQVLVFGATGNMGGATARELLRRGWRVRAVSRDPGSEKAAALASLGAEVVQGDMEDRASLEAAFDGIRRVFSVQNWTISGTEGEIRQGKLVAEAAQSAGVEHLVYGSAGSGDPDTGVPHFDAKLVVEAYMRQLGLPFTIIRPVPFMELLSEKEFYPALAAWGAQPKVLGWDLPIPWVAVRDLGLAIVEFFQNPGSWVGREVVLAGDVKSLAECRDTFESKAGKKPTRIPLPLWLFRRMAGDEFVLMWRWMASWISQQGPEQLWELVERSRALNAALLGVDEWLETRKEMEVPLVSASPAAT